MRGQDCGVWETRLLHMFLPSLASLTAGDWCMKARTVRVWEHRVFLHLSYSYFLIRKTALWIFSDSHYGVREAVGVLSTHLPTWSVTGLVYSPGTSLNMQNDPASCNYRRQICTQIIYSAHNFMWAKSSHERWQGTNDSNMVKFLLQFFSAL